MVNSRRKGSQAERAVIKILSKHFLGKFERRSMGIQGADIICSDDNFKYAVEVKHVKTVRALHLLMGNHLLNAWWKQAREQAGRVNKQPLLVAKVEGKFFCTEVEPNLCLWEQFEKWCQHQI